MSLIASGNGCPSLHIPFFVKHNHVAILTLYNPSLSFNIQVDEDDEDLTIDNGPAAIRMHADCKLEACAQRAAANSAQTQTCWTRATSSCVLM